MNSYLVYGDDEFFNERNTIIQIIEMANLSMNRKDEPIMLGNNMEGALLLHMAFQNMRGPLI